VIRLDYLRRDVLFWRKLRFLYAPAAAVGIVLYFTHYWYPLPDTMAIGFALIFAGLIYGMLTLAKGAAVTRDLTFKSHIRWFGLFLLVFIIAGFMYVLTYSDQSFLVPNLFVFMVSSYCLFRMAKSLVPSGKLPAG